MADARDWSGELGATWASVIDAMDRQLEPAGAFGLAALAPKPGERILDLGCGGGPSSLAIAQAVGETGRVMGLDISADLVAVARQRAAEMPQLSFSVGDAGALPLEPGWDALHSRFGSMFFDDPPAALAHLRAALKPGGRAVLTVWAEPKHNPWAMLPANAAAEVLGPAERPAPGAPGPFGWASPEIFEPILQAAGWRDLSYEEHDLEMVIGFGDAPDPIARAVELATKIGPMASRLQDAPEAEGEMRAVLAQKLAPFQSEGHVRLAGKIRVISAAA